MPGLRTRTWTRVGREPRGELVRDGGGQLLDQPVLAAVRHLAHAGRDGAVVHGRLEAIFGRLVDGQLDVVEEGSAGLPLVVVDAVPPEDLQADEPDDHPTTARAAVSASTCSFTSCTRRIVAPRS